MASSLASQIDEWAKSDLGTLAMEFARKRNYEDALQDKLMDLLRKYKNEQSPYPDIKHLHAVILKATINRQRDIHNRDSARRGWQDKWSATRQPAKTSDPEVEDERREKERRQEVARNLALEMFETLEPLEQIAILVDPNISGNYVYLDISRSNQTLDFDPETLGRIQAAAARLKPPVSEPVVCEWRRLEDVARSLGLSPETLRSKRHRAKPKLQRFLENRGISFEYWNAFAFDD